MPAPIRSGDVVPDGVRWAVTTDPLPYGFAAQGGVLDTLADYLVEQGLVADRVEVTDLFAASTRDL